MGNPTPALPERRPSALTICHRELVITHLDGVVSIVVNPRMAKLAVESLVRLVLALAFVKRPSMCVRVVSYVLSSVQYACFVPILLLRYV